MHDCSEVLKECQQEYAKNEKGYEDKLKRYQKQIDECKDNKEINMLLNIIKGNNTSLEEKDNECKSSLEEKDNECKSSLEEKEMEYQQKIRKFRDDYEKDKERINKNLGNRIYECNKDKKSCDERENDCINENIELKRENEELKKQIKSNNQNSKCSQTTPKTSIIICVIIIVLLLGLCIYLYFFKR